jgi:toxin FitB
LILLDTNVVSEVMRRAPIPKVVTWLNNANSNELYLSSISIAEIAYGLQVLPEGKRRQEIATRFVQFLEGGFNFRTLAFDDRAAFAYGDLMATTRALGRPMSMPDGQIAAIAKSQGMSLATRNVNDFEATGLTLINPWMQ